MRVVIVGVGDIGLHLAEILISSSENELVLIDTDQEKCKELRRKFDSLVLNEDGTDPEVLTDAEVRKADVLVASTGFDPANLLIAMLGQHFSVPYLLIKLNDKAHKETCDELGIDGVVIPDLLGAHEMEKKLNSWVEDKNFEL